MIGLVGSVIVVLSSVVSFVKGDTLLNLLLKGVKGVLWLILRVFCLFYWFCLRWVGVCFSSTEWKFLSFFLYEYWLQLSLATDSFFSILLISFYILSNKEEWRRLEPTYDINAVKYNNKIISLVIKISSSFSLSIIHVSFQN